MRPSSENVSSSNGSPTLSTPASSSVGANSSVWSCWITPAIASRRSGVSRRSPAGAANTRMSTPPCSSANSASIRSVARCVSEPGISNSSLRLPPTVPTRTTRATTIPIHAPITRQGCEAQARAHRASPPVASRSCAARRATRIGGGPPGIPPSPCSVMSSLPRRPPSLYQKTSGERRSHRSRRDLPTAKSRPPGGPPLSALGLRALRLHVRDVVAHVLRRLRVGVAEGLLHPGHVLLGPGREVVVDRAQELERRGEAEVRDRRRVAADELPPLQEVLVVDVQRVGKRGLGVLLCPRLHVVVGGGRSRDLARVLREAQRRVRRAREQRVEGADQVEHRVVDHRPLARVARIELVEAVLVAEVGHDRAALAERPPRKPLLLEHRRQVGGILLQVLRARRLPPDIVLLEVEPGGS